MIKQYGLWYTVKYYCIIHFLIFASAIFLPDAYLVHWLNSRQGSLPQIIVYNLFTFALIILSVILYGSAFLTVYMQKNYKYKTNRNYFQDHRTYNRSFSELRRYFQDAEPHRLDTSRYPVRPWPEAEGILFGTHNRRLISIPSHSEGNIAVFGPPGSGKTAGIAIPAAVCFAGATMVIDIKGDIYDYVSKHTKRKIIRFCPDSPTALKDSYKFDPLAGFGQMSLTNQKRYLEFMAMVLIPDEGGDAGNYFSSRARKMLQGIAHLLLGRNPDTSFPDIIHAILKGNIFDWVRMSKEGNCGPARECLDSLYGNSEKNVTSAYDALTTALRPFSDPVLDRLLDKHGNNHISIEMLENGTDIYLQISQEHLDAYAPLFTLMIQSFSTAFTKRPDMSKGIKKRPILMLLDEFPQLTFSYNLINSNLSTLRSKSVMFMLIQQNLAQLEAKYQPPEARSILGNCKYQVILGSNDAKSSEVFSSMFGKRKTLKTSTSETISQNSASGRTVQEAEEPVFPPEHFGDLSSGNKMILYFDGKYCECDKINCYKD